MMDDKFNLSRWINHVTPVISWIILCPLAYGYAFAQSGTQPPENSNGSYGTLDPSMAIVILVFVAIFFILAMFSIYVQTCSESRADGSGLPSRVGMDLSRRCGVDPAVIETFPIFAYSEVKDLKIGKGALECAVCLSDFEDDETLRLLLRCDHVFHRDCVDMWLASHVTCPVCRAVLVPEAKETVKLTDSINEFTQIQSNSTSEFVEDRNRVVIDISTDEQSSNRQVIGTSDTTAMRNRPLSIGILDKFPRSHSTGHSLVLAGVNTDRYTLKLPEDVRKQLMMTVKLKRTVSFNVLPREGSSRGYKYGGGEGTSGGRSYVDRQGGRSDRWVFSMTPPFVSKTGSVNFANKVAGRDDGEGSNSNGRMLSMAVKSPLNCLKVKVEQGGDLYKQ